MTTNGTNGDDTITGNSFDDVVIGNNGSDRIFTGTGNDLIFSVGGNDFLDGGANVDFISGGSGIDTIGGGSGDDIIIGGYGNDVLTGGTGDDIISGGSGVDTFQYKAGFGHDIITDFTFGTDRLNLFVGAIGNTKNITVSSYASLAKVIADYAFTVTDLDQDAVKVDMGAYGSLTFLNAASAFGFALDDSNATGTGTDDELFGSETDGGEVVGGAGNDTILGGSGASHIQGDADNDLIIGGGRNDTIGGQAGNDTLVGNGGNDQLAGRSGDDYLEGNDGADSFRFSGSDFGHDTVLDLDFDEGDRLVFFAGSVSAENISVTNLAEFVDLAASVASSFTVDEGTLTLNFGANSVSFAQFGDLVI